MVKFDLGPERYRPSATCPGYSMRINKAATKIVVFIGTTSGTDFKAGGTGFLVHFDGFIYLVTAKHVATALPDAPIALRFNNIREGTSFIHLDPLNGWKWYFHEDDTVDAAVLPISHDLDKFDHLFYPENKIDYRAFPQDQFMDDNKIAEGPVGFGDMCYTVGFFRLLVGNKKNLPVVHSGSIARIAGDELIPVRDWDDPTRRDRKMISAYLVEQQSLQGLSGSPVFVRLPIMFNSVSTDLGVRDIVVSEYKVMLLGLWQGSWDAKADEVLAMDKGREMRVPVGMGVVVPCQKIKDILEDHELKAKRDEARRYLESEGLAKPDSLVGETEADTEKIAEIELGHLHHYI